MAGLTLRESVTPASTAISRPPILPSRWSLIWFACLPLRAYNVLRRGVRRRSPGVVSNLTPLQEIRELAANPSDINEHLELMFVDAILSQPALIVELGVRAGTSTFVFERVAAMCASDVVSVDLDDCSRATNIRCHFHKGDDVQFAVQFQDFCARRSIVPAIDLLFVDTSHYYDHTVQEIKAWFPLLSSRAKVMFHDTNSRVVGHRTDGCFELAWDNERGVIRAIEEFLNVAIDESKESIQYSKGWLVRHWPNCNGFTILDRLDC